jgi:hypothetical protein
MVMHRVCVEAGSKQDPTTCGPATLQGRCIPNKKTSDGELEMDQAARNPAQRQRLAWCAKLPPALITPGRRAPSHSLERKQGASAILWGARRWATTSRRRLRQGPRQTALRFSRGSHTFASNATLRFAARRARRRLWQPAASSARNRDLRKVHGFQDFGPFALALL